MLKSWNRFQKQVFPGTETNAYITWRNHFFWQRLRLWLWLALICVLSFTVRDIYDLFFPLKELNHLPEVLREEGLVINCVMLWSIAICFGLHPTTFGRRYPGILFLGLSWSISLVQQIFATLNHFALPDTLAWSLLFVSQATLMPVRWNLHFLSQLVLLVYYFGVNTALGLTSSLPKYPGIYNVTLILYVFWLCVMCDMGVYLYDRLQAKEFFARKELELAKAALKEQLDFLRVLINTIPTPVFYKNIQGEYIGWNQAFADATGLQPQEIMGKTVYDIAPPDLAQQYHQADRELLGRRGIQIEEATFVYADGKKRDVIFYKATFEKADGCLGGIVGIILDITQRKHTEESLRVFYHAVSHDLRNPVIGTLMVLQNLLNREMGVTEETIAVPRKFLQKMMESSDRQLHLINSLMEAHQSEVQGIFLQRDNLAISRIAEAAIADLQPLLQENQVIVKNLISADLPLIFADGNQLWRVFSNLIVNAIKHNPPGLQIILNATVEGDKIHCSVADNGVGLTPQQQENLFQLYFQAHQVRNSLSLGLGLYLCKQIILAHGGEIGVTSLPNSGANFWFTLIVMRV
ncbi:sensor histidine kinase [Calothrix sp. 336/3]|uniref:sensor histidine kinase n=1 Tax=Calothrix sp. 336/3 TaxID=1337936 RepID=UPI000624E265|nr:HAMP domain-containing sensor histidine kinase [Calothrix sp. 336/3]AKG21639.1 ATPase [Calothrix sp. 336/3]